MTGRAPEHPEHRCLEATAGRPIGTAPLTDQQRVAVVLQAAAVLSLLDQAGWRLVEGWGSGRVDRHGLLGCVEAVRGQPVRGCRELLTSLTERLFGGSEGVPGRGQARRAVRDLTSRWRCSPAAISPDRLVEQILESAPFLWRPRFAAARARLVGRLITRDHARLWVAGPDRFRDRLSAAGETQAVEALLAGPAALRIWREALGAAAGTDSVVREPISTDEARQLHSRLRAAEEAWRRHDLAGLERHLQWTRSALGDDHLAWRWQRLMAERAEAAGDGELVVRHLELALRRTRRKLGGSESAELWRGLASGRALLGDLAGAERALGHAARLAFRGQSELLQSRVLADLASIRLRRGRIAEAQETLDRRRRLPPLKEWSLSTLEVELQARLELARGRPEAALARMRPALSEAGGASPRDWRRRVPHLLAARALCWLDLGEEALPLVAGTPARAWLELEAEERPALWLSVGRRRWAREASSGPCGPLWRKLLAREAPDSGWWRELSRLEPFRAARLVRDIERLFPGAAPPAWRRRIAEPAGYPASPRSNRADAARGERAWRAFSAYLQEERGAAASLARLFTEAGYPEVRLYWRNGAREQVLLPGEGGPGQLEEPCGRGRVILAARRIDVVVRALFALAVSEIAPPDDLVGGLQAGDGMIGESRRFRRALARIDRLARADLPVLILGETGTGKELAVRRVHRLSRRAESPLLAVNCGAFSESLLLSELFGHVRGAFTGAARDRVGIFEAARGGTVFLDEVGDLPLPAQGKLLRVLQEGEVRRLGESLPRRIDVRIVAATHRDLTAMAAEGGFRRDLYYRLRVACVELPALREREDDVIRLAEHFLSGATARLGAEARRRLMAYSWPGNVRELENVVRVAAALSDGGFIQPRHLEIPTEAETSPLGYHRQIEDLRRRLVREALGATRGNRAAAARRLGLSRQALSYLARRFEIS